MTSERYRASDMAELGPWVKRNVFVLRLFGPVLVLTGVLGFLVPADMALMSGAPAYDVFHIVAGVIGIALVLAKRVRAVSWFNAAFGGIDLYQALAGVTGWFPAELFAYRMADHVLHVLIGAGLLVLGVLGLRERA
jgi:hypothetical protein